jgi:hypothetical protein
MKEGEEGAQSTFVTPRRRRKRRCTDFSNRKARHRREEKKRGLVLAEVTGTPLKERLPNSRLKFCSIRKLILNPVEGVNDIIEGYKFEGDHLYEEGIEGCTSQMTGGRRLKRKQIITSPQPQPPIIQEDSQSHEYVTESSEECDTEPVSYVTYFLGFSD